MLLRSLQLLSDPFLASQRAASAPKVCRAFSALHSSAACASTASQPNTPYDVVIFGGGMVGIAFAALLGTNPITRNLRVAVVDRQKLSGQQAPLDGPPDARVSTITPASAAILQKIGAWYALAPPLSAAFASMQVWDAAGQAYIRYRADEVGEDHIGHVVENSRLQAAIVAAMSSQGVTSLLRVPQGSKVELLAPASLRSLELCSATSSRESAGLAELVLEDGRSLRARLVVGADGANSRVRGVAGLRTLGWSYQQRGVVATVQTHVPSDTAWQRFLPGGPLALLPVRGGMSNIVWSTTPEHVHRLEQCTSLDLAGGVNKALGRAADRLKRDTAIARSIAVSSSVQAKQLEQCTSLELAGQVNEALGHSEGPPAAPLTKALQDWLPGGSGGDSDFQRPPLVTGYVGGPPRSFPLRLCHAGRYVRKRVALIGDAAHAVHPLAGQGVNLGLADANTLAAALATAVESGTDVGDDDFLADTYEAPRQKANIAMMGALDALGRVFVPQSGPLAGVRSLGLDLLNASGPAKQRIMRYAMGWA